MIRALAVVLFLGLTLRVSPQTSAAPSPVSGAWRGNSECTVKNSPCHDETNIYRFSPVSGQPGRYTGDGFRMANGKEILMGTLEWQYDPQTHVLESKFPNGVFRLVITGDKIEGTLLLPDGTLYRRIHLTKAN